MTEPLGADHGSLDPTDPRRWRTWREALFFLTRRRVIRRSLMIALVVGTLLSIVNQLHVIVSGDADAATSLRIAANYVIPYIVSSVGAAWAMKAD